ncbi:MAG: acyl-CoA/acyl-ACP dehydrogenase, partial [Chloroflexi bacterium]|nr:acyl-CoA/acyl-ACP dehydrogenase [Chloroflexota bacterium]
MDLLPDEQEQALKKSAREFLEGECPPKLARAMEKDELGYPPELWKKMADLGWLGLAIPEKYGGQGLPLTYLGLVLEEIGRAIAPVPFHTSMVPALAIASDGTEEQRQELLPRVSQGDLILTWAMTEADHRLVPEAIQAEAKKDGDDYVITGTKLFVEYFSVAEKCLLACRTARASSNSEGISLFLVDTNSRGISETPLVNMAREKQSKVTFDRVRVPKKNLVGELNMGWPALERMLDRATALLCAQMVGTARKQAEMAIEYAKQRVAFGKPIGAFQAIAHPCADMIIWVDGARMLTYEALWRMDQGLPASIDESQPKAFCNDKCLAIGHHSNIIHG